MNIFGVSVISGLIIAASLLGSAWPAHAEEVKPRPQIFAHYLPWYESRPTSKKFGWHWTMDHFDPSKMVRGRRQVASHFDPLIGLYDSSDPYALECHTLLMKFAGIDGVIIDWYGRDNFLDYAVLDRNTTRLIENIHKAGLHFALMYEDRVVPKLIKGNIIKEADAAAHGAEMMRWLEKNWFNKDDYLKLEGRPVFLVFGPQYYKADAWKQLFAGLKPEPILFTEYDPKDGGEGAFYWPSPEGGAKLSKGRLDAYYQRAAGWKINIPCAYPRFEDIYEQAGVHPSYGNIKDHSGRIYRLTLERALSSGQPIIQIATWNDWGEGTQIEPSVEFGYRELETTQELRRKHGDKSFKFTSSDLRLPVQLYRERRQPGTTPARQKQLDEAAALLYAGNVSEAVKLLNYSN